LFPGRPLHPPQKKEKETLLRYWSYGHKEGI
jgi:hypothetical protein